MNFKGELLGNLPWNDIGATFVIVAGALLLRWLFVRRIRSGSETLTPEQRKWISLARNTTFAVIAVSLVAIWALELSKFALSVAAFAVAIVIAGKEIILCVTGGLYRAVAGPFDVGDWIEVGPIKGEVLQSGVFATQLQELSDSVVYQDYTGRTVTLPNSMLLSHPVENLNFTRHFIYHTFQLTVKTEDAEPEADLALIGRELDAVWSGYEELATRYWGMVRKRSGVELRDPRPEAGIGTTDLAHIAYYVRIFCQRTNAAEIEKTISLRLIDQIAKRVRNSAEAGT